MPGRKLAPDAVSRLVQPRRERPQGAFSRRHRHDPARDPALPGHSDIEKPVARGLVHPGGRHHGQHMPADVYRDDSPPGQGVDPSVGQGGAHDSEVLGADLKAALPGVQVDCFGWVGIHPVPAGQQVRNSAITVIGSRGGGVHLIAHGKVTAGETGQPRGEEEPFLRAALTGYQAGGGDGPGIDHRVRPAVRAALDEGQRVERKPGRIHAELAPDLFGAERLAHQGEDKGLGHTHDRELLPGIPRPPDAAADADDADAEQVCWHPGQRRIRL